jgi:NADH-quinone oxidoreductase subunit N
MFLSELLCLKIMSFFNSFLYLPEAVLILWILVLTIVAAWSKVYRSMDYKVVSRFYLMGSYFVLLFNLLLFLNQFSLSWLVGEAAFFDLLFFDFYTQFVKLVSTVLVLCLIIVSVSYAFVSFLFSLEVIVLFFFSLLSMYLMLSANDLVLLYMILEMQGLSFYVLAASDVGSLKSTESGLKYFIVGSLASISFLFGVFFFYWMFGTTNLTSLGMCFFWANSTGVFFDNLFLLSFAWGFIVVGFFFKLAAGPFHLWVADVYEGAPTHITAFFAVVSKLVLFSVFVKILFLTFMFEAVFLVFGLISLFVGSFAALYQTNLKRLMAYGGVAHVGFLLFGLGSSTFLGVEFVYVYLLIYCLLSLNFFSVLLSLRRNESFFELKTINELSGLFRSNITLCVIFVLNIFSLAGIPPLSGFFGKAFVLFSAVDAGLFFTSLLFICLSVVTAFYYIRMVKIAVYESRFVWAFYQPISRGSSWIISFTFLLNLFFFFYWNVLMDFLSEVISLCFN